MATMKRGRESGDIETMAMANCLMLLSKVGQIDPSKHNNMHQSRVFACKTCDKRFSSFQALGGHRASHKKPRLTEDMTVSSPKKPKTHECSICGLEFPIGQALGGHMRRHRAASNEGLVNRHDLFSEMKKPDGGADGGLCLDLKLGTCGTDLDFKLEKVAPPPTPIVHLFI
ncbi:Zinc finger protein ZAT12 [Hibiscus syriacus]|uniref:Zinc finger protein ZAT12 n=1 Tax=Hibiscus syriacus TaxID=106335 RepID=A0A6A2Y9I6_HIBSY|nr:zinc finger protein ZAT12-like [Hibiscus syriacus]KAE8678925.1 Zinc finger protein ZAT12 [Hibiscus syriacus]